MLNTQLTDLAVNAQLDALSTLADGGFLRIYDGVKPITADTPVTSQKLLAELKLGTPAFGASAGGVITANAISDEMNAPNTGNASWFRVFMADGSTALWDGTVGTSNANMILNSTVVQKHARVAITYFTHTLPKAGA